MINKITRINEVSIRYIETKEELVKVVSILKEEEILGVDTETYIDLSKSFSSALDPHSSLISTVQLSRSTDKIAYIIDVITIGIDNCKCLIENIIVNKSILKVFHNASFDMKQFKRSFGVWPINVSCTLTLLKSLAICTGYKANMFRGNSYKDMCRDLFGVHLDKEEAISFWGSRPLSKEQLEYAALDVVAKADSPQDSYLLEGYRILISQLELLNQGLAYKADIQAMEVTARLEYEGMYVDTNILDKITAYALEKKDKSMNSLVSGLGFTIYKDIDMNEQGQMISVTVIPDKIKKLLNNNKLLVNYVNDYLKANRCEALTSLQADEIKGYLDNLEKEMSSDDIEDYFYLEKEDIFGKYDGISLIKDLLEYKTYNKLVSECNKYYSVINPNTGCVHAGFNATGSSTGRMSSSGDLNLQQVSKSLVTIELDKDEV
jgi:DNA polymerase I-like protein with 3'-5' exonuclease and polymerase domains